ncbi:hypothetical protein [Nakamurella lactea]|uniref:hypothetical protein n=1 Tax=Nakamurella lactea TaxID=459515 RepID=UPI0003F92F5B|nr:hypothetical protein [Nakamurella lactea]
MSTTPQRQAGTPTTRSPVRAVEPPQTVLIDLGALYGRQPHFRRPNVLLIASLHYTAVAELDAWVLAETGWFGACRYRVKLAYGQYIEQNHLVPAWALRLATDFDLAQARMRGELEP